MRHSLITCINQTFVWSDWIQALKDNLCTRLSDRDLSRGLPEYEERRLPCQMRHSVFGIELQSRSLYLVTPVTDLLLLQTQLKL
jgi:hypothetical protein